MHLRRAVTFDEFADRLSRLFTFDDVPPTVFAPRPSDVIISPFAKCGTTWLQQIVHSLRTGGDMDFTDIYDVVPWIDIAAGMGIDLDADQRANPRAFKSHASWNDVPKGCRYIVSFRDPKDAVVSFYHFMVGWLIEPGAISIEDFVERRALDRDNGPDYWRHMASWLSQRDNPDVLLLTFEEMKRDHRGAVRRVARFLEIDADDALIDIATERSSFAFMSANRGPFAEPWLKARAEEVAGTPPGSDASKVRTGNVGDHHRELPTKTVTRLDEIWAETIAAEFGYPSYGDLDADLREGTQVGP